MDNNQNTIPLIAIVGRTNVGKSTLFNLLSHQNLAVVADRPGVTRDRNYVVLNNYRRPFSLVDTGGLLGEENNKLATAVTEQTEIAIHEADLILAIFDGKNGHHPLDLEVVDLLRRSNKPVLWVVNKCDGKDFETRATEFYNLGLEELHLISAAHNQGIRDLFKAIWDKLFIFDQKELKPEEEDNTIKVAILGKPNAGKSTLVNKLLGEQRQITSPIAGTTRDSVNITLTRDGQDFKLIDTAGLRKQRNIGKETMEQIFSFRTLKSLAECDVAVLMLDGEEGIPTHQDAKIADLIHQRGKGLVIVVNKWDAVEKDHRTVKEYQDQIKQVLQFCSYAPIVFTSALTGKRCPSVLEAVKKVYEAGKLRIKTNEINNIVEAAIQKNPPPIYRGLPVKFYFATQIDGNPPTFVLFFNNPKRITESYTRYLKNYIRAQHQYIGYDIKIITRKRRSKYEQDKS